MRGPSGFRKNNGNYPISIYRYPEYAPYFSVISMMIMRDLGFHKYSDHAWSRGPVVECGQALPMGLA